MAEFLLGGSQAILGDGQPRFGAAAAVGKIGRQEDNIAQFGPLPLPFPYPYPLPLPYPSP